jgi:laccase
MSMGMVAVFIVEDGSSVDTSLPPPPADFPKCNPEEKTLVRDESYPK